MLHFRNTYKNSKLMLFYMIIAILSLIISSSSLLFALLPEFRKVALIVCLVFSLLFIVSFLLLIMKNNDYKLKYYFRLSEFNKEFKKLKKENNGNKKRLRFIKKQQKDHFLQFGEVVLSTKMLIEPVNKWNEWVEESTEFNYNKSQYMEKLSYITYVLYHACMSGGGLEEFFRWISYEPFTGDELINTIAKNEFFSNEFKDFLTMIIKEFDKEKEDELFEKYELSDNNVFFEFENEILNLANWLAYNRKLLSSCVGIYLHGNIDFNMYKLFLSKDYKKVIYIFSVDDKLFKVDFIVWNEMEVCWIPGNVSNNSIYDSVETALNNIKDFIKDYIEIGI